MRPRIVVAVGLPGSGKSSHLQQAGAHPISSDAIRLQLMDDESDQSANQKVFAVVRNLLLHRVDLRRPVTFIDATNLTRRERRVYIGIAREHGCAIEALWFDTPVALCRARNAGRPRMVPEYVLDLMAAKFVPPSTDEGFERVLRLRAPAC